MQLPIFEIITEAISDTWSNRRDLATFAFLPVLLVSIVGTVITFIVGNPQVTVADQTLTPPQVTTPLIIGSMIMMAVVFVVYTLFSVVWHRRTLVGSEAVTVRASMQWGRRQWRFFGQLVSLLVRLFALLILLTTILSFAFGGAFPGIPVLSAMFIVLGLIYARSALVLPAATIDNPMKFSESMRLTRGNSWRLLIAIVVLPRSSPRWSAPLSVLR
jgi:hypothetical protein